MGPRLLGSLRCTSRPAPCCSSWRTPTTSSRSRNDATSEALGRHFDLSQDEVRNLIDLAEQERRQATDLYRFTAVINQSYDEGQRMALAEVLWRVVFADGHLSEHETYLMRKLSNLLDLRPGYLAEARRRAGGA